MAPFANLLAFVEDRPGDAAARAGEGVLLDPVQRFEASFASESGIKFATDLSPFPVSEVINRVAEEGPNT
jgi:hypothetical protein